MEDKLYLQYDETKMQKNLIKIIDIAMCVFGLVYFLVSLIMFVLPNVDLFSRTRFILGFIVVCLECTYFGYMFFFHPNRKIAVRNIFQKFFSFETIALFFLVLLFALSCIFYPLLSHSTKSITNSFMENKSIWSEVFYQVFVLFPFGMRMTKLIDKKMVRIVIHIFLIVVTIGELFILYHVFTNDPIIINQYSIIGIDDAYRLNFAVNSNTTGMMAYSIMFISVCMMVLSGKKLKLICLIEALIAFSVLILSGSRGSIYPICIIIGLMIGVYLFKKAKTNKQKFISIVLGILTILLTIGMMKLFYDFSLLIIKPIETPPVLASTNQYSAGVFLLAKADNAGYSNRLISTYSSGRTEIWKSALKAFVYNPSSFVFGVTPINVSVRLNAFIDNTKLGRFVMHTHNQFLEIGLGYGVPAMCVFILFVILLFKKSIQLLVRKDILYKWLMPSFGIALIIFNNIFEPYLIGSNLPYVMKGVMCSGLFPLFCGMLIYRCRLLKIGKMENKIIECASDRTVRIFSLLIFLILCIVIVAMVLFHI